jgi:hypothetical protein
MSPTTVEVVALRVPAPTPTSTRPMPRPIAPGTSARDRWPSMIITAAPNSVLSAPRRRSETQPPRIAEAYTRPPYAPTIEAAISWE